MTSTRVAHQHWGSHDQHRVLLRHPLYSGAYHILPLAVYHTEDPGGADGGVCAMDAAHEAILHNLAT